jgi:hypothetical protein
MDDAYSKYEHGMLLLLERLGRAHLRYSDALNYQGRLQENVDLVRRHGDNETYKSERAQIIEQLNRLVLDSFGMSFHELYSHAGPLQPTEPSPEPKPAICSKARSSPEPLPQSGPNPFEYGTPVPPDRFYGRSSQRADIKNRLGGISAQSISIVGLRRNGKSSLLRYIRERPAEFFQPDQRPLIVSLDLQKAQFQSTAGILEGLRRGISAEMGSEPWQRGENDDPFVVDDGLEKVRKSGRRLVVLIDEFEQIGKRLTQFQDWGDDWRAKASSSALALCIASTHPLDQIYQSCGLTSPFGNIFTTTTLGAFEDNEWRSLVRNGFKTGGRDLNDVDLALIFDLAGGLPYYTQMAASLLWQYNDSQHVKAEFVLQAVPRFSELWNDLKEAERDVLRYSAKAAGSSAPDTNLRAALQRPGLLRYDGSLFSSAFAEFVRAQ